MILPLRNFYNSSHNFRQQKSPAKFWGIFYYRCFLIYRVGQPSFFHLQVVSYRHAIFYTWYHKHDQEPHTYQGIHDGPNAHNVGVFILNSTL